MLWRINMAKNKNDCLKDLEKDITYFLCMCTKEDAKLLISDPKEKTIEDFGRLLCLGLAFNMRGVFLSVFAQYEKVGDIENLLDFIKTITFEQTKKWVEDFLAKIDNPTLKECAKSIWQGKKKHLSENDFELSKLFYN